MTLQWHTCDGNNINTWPLQAGFYAFMILVVDPPLDSGEVFVYPPELTVGVVHDMEEGAPDNPEGHPGITLLYDQDTEHLVAWYGPLDIPKCCCLKPFEAATLRKGVVS